METVDGYPNILYDRSQSAAPLSGHGYGTLDSFLRLASDDDPESCTAATPLFTPNGGSSTTFKPIVRTTQGSRTESKNKVVLNVGGRLFVTYPSTLSRIPNTRLSLLTPSSSEFEPEHNWYFFDRKAVYFEFILDLYRTGDLHLPPVSCERGFRKELEFWGIKDWQVSPCCQARYFQGAEEFRETQKIEVQFSQWNLYRPNSKIRWFERLWFFLDDPLSSTAATVWAYFTLVLVFLSILLFYVETVESWRIPRDNFNMTEFKVAYGDDIANNSKLTMWYVTEEPPVLRWISFTLQTWFTVEFVLRWALCGNHKDYLKDWLNILDLISSFMPWVAHLVQAAVFYQDPIGTHRAVIVIMSIMGATRLMRVFRVFRLSHQFGGLRVLLLTIKNSKNELLLLVVFVLIGMVFFGALVYYSELTEASTFADMPIGLWWSVVTMTSVGYGDHVPKTWLGYLCGMLCAVVGMFIMGLPVPIVANHFTRLYMHSNRLRKQRKTDEWIWRNEHGLSEFRSVDQLDEERATTVIQRRRHSNPGTNETHL